VAWDAAGAVAILGSWILIKRAWYTGCDILGLADHYRGYAEGGEEDASSAFERA
jgi:hypothetical protein